MSYKYMSYKYMSCEYMSLISTFLYFLFFTFAYTQTLINYTTSPIVVLHGIASSSNNMNEFCNWLDVSFNRKVFNIEIGNGQQNSLFMPLNKQLDMLCNTIYSIPDLQNGFDFIGMSQGGLLARGYVEKCNKYPVFNLINMVTPNGGVIEDTTLDLYTPFYQEHFSVGSYWRNPVKLDEYLSKCSYLPIMNNERNTDLSAQFKQNILSLQNYIVIWSPFDNVVNPPESAKFSVYDKYYNILPLQETELYKNDLLGLKKLYETNRFHIYETNCTHVEHRDPVCFSQLYNIFKNYM